MTELFDLSGKVALVTGASSGLGAHFAKVLANAGASVAMGARRKDRLDALASEIAEGGGKAHALSLDVTDETSCVRAIEETEKVYGPIEVLINNAGVERTEPFLQASEENWDYVMDANLKAVWRLGRMVANRMIEQKIAGSIVNIASILGLGTFANQSSYATSKAGVVHLTKSMATELFQYGIRVNAICPGFFVTEMNDFFLESEQGKMYVERTPPRRPGNLYELDGPLLMFASDASSFVTGTALPVDGGHSIRLV